MIGERRARVAALVVAVLLDSTILLLGGSGTSAGSAAAGPGDCATTIEVGEDCTSTAPTTSESLLVPGDGTEGAESTTTTTQTPTRVSSEGTSDGALLAMIVGGLVLLALAVSILTWRYWVATRPSSTATVGSDHG